MSCQCGTKKRLVTSKTQSKKIEVGKEATHGSDIDLSLIDATG